MKESKNTIIGVIVVIVVIALIGVGFYFFTNKTNDNKTAQASANTSKSSTSTTNTSTSKSSTNTANTNTSKSSTNTASKSSSSEKEEIVKNTLEEYFKIQYGKVIEEVKFQDVKIYTQQEINNDELLKDYDLKPNDIVFEVQYSLKIIDGYDKDEMMQFTAATGEIEGQWVKNKYNCGIAKYNSENDYTIENFGTSF